MEICTRCDGKKVINLVIMDPESLDCKRNKVKCGCVDPKMNDFLNMWEKMQTEYRNILTSDDDIPSIFH